MENIQLLFNNLYSKKGMFPRFSRKMWLMLTKCRFSWILLVSVLLIACSFRNRLVRYNSSVLIEIYSETVPLWNRWEAWLLDEKSKHFMLSVFSYLLILFEIFEFIWNTLHSMNLDYVRNSVCLLAFPLPYTMPFSLIIQVGSQRRSSIVSLCSVTLPVLHPMYK